MARTLDEAVAKATEANTRAGSLIALFHELKAQLDAILAGALTPAQQAKVDALFDIDADTVADIDEALNTNVPPAEPPA